MRDLQTATLNVLLPADRRVRVQFGAYEAQSIGRNRAQRLMRNMGLIAVYLKPETSQPHPQHKTSPYLLRGNAITRPNQVWCADITYIPMQRGFLYLVEIMDWHSRAMLTWRVRTPWMLIFVWPPRKMQ